MGRSHTQGWLAHSDLPFSEERCPEGDTFLKNRKVSAQPGKDKAMGQLRATQGHLPDNL